MGLNYGSNSISYKALTSCGSLSLIEGKIYLYNYDDKLIVSDIDGTVTKSDILGHIYSFLGLDWIHADICRLFSLLQERGFHMIYLTARPLLFYNHT